MDRSCHALGACLVLAAAGATPLKAATMEAPEDAARSIVAEIDDERLSGFLTDVLESNPDLAAAAAAARAADRHAEGADVLPNPELGLLGYVEPPETRVGPQRFMASLSQRFPGFGTLDRRGQIAALEAARAAHALEAERLRLVRETRQLWAELAYLDEWARILRVDHATLAHYEEVSRTRYSSGVGLQQDVVKIQAEMTRVDERLLDLSARRSAIAAKLNALRDRPGAIAIAEVGQAPHDPPDPIDARELLERAARLRPEVGSALAGLAKARLALDLARRENVPDVALGVSYTIVDRRNDPAGRAMPPPDDGSDIVGLSAKIDLPLWRGRIDSGIREAKERELEAGARHRAVLAAIDRDVTDLARRLGLTAERLSLLEDVLVVQATQALRSAESAYAAGALNALDLLDAERMLLDAKKNAARARADFSSRLAEIESTVGGPLSPPSEEAP